MQDLMDEIIYQERLLSSLKPGWKRNDTHDLLTDLRNE